jgi:sec-independent protein translocase protein TatC
MVEGHSSLKREEIFQALERFRKGFLQMAIVFLLVAAATFPFSKAVLRHLRDTTLKMDLVAFGIPESFLSLLKLTAFISLFISIPFIFYHLSRAVSPLLRKRGVERSSPILWASILLFYLGALFCYFVTLPFGVTFLLGYQTPKLQPMISVSKYVSFCAVFVFGFGLTFELPLVLALLSYLGIVNARFLSRNRRYAILLCAVAAAVITPTPDMFNMALMGVPLYLLFEIGVILVKFIERKRRAEASGEASQ